MKIYNIGGWLVLAAMFLGLGALRYEPTPAVDLPAVTAQIDTVTYGDARIVYKLSTDTARNSNGDLRRLPDLAAAPEGSRWRVIWSPSFDSVMLVTGDTFALSPMDSADATALATSWGVIDPHTVDLAWHVPPGEAPDPLENVAVVAVHDTLRTSWTSVGDSVRIFSGLDAGGQEDTFYVAGSATPHDRVVTTIPGDYYSCGNAYTTQAAADYADNRCGSATIDTTGGGGGTGDFPNEPAGFTQITQRSFDAEAEDGWTSTSSANYTVPVTDATAPTSPSNVGRTTYPAGKTGGNSGAGSRRRDITATDEVYFAFTFKVSSNWQGHDSGVNKILFITDDTYGGGGDPAFVALFGVDQGQLNLQTRLQGPGTEESLSQGGNINANLGSATLTRGQWYEIEVHYVANTGNNHDGEVHMWVDGVKTHEYTDVRFFHDSADPSDHTFDNIRWNAIWGGVGDTVDEEQHQFMDHFYISAP